MKSKFRVSMIAASLALVASSAFALEAKYSESDIPTLTSDKQHATASKRVTSQFTRSHYKHFQLDDAFSEQIFDRYLKSLDFNRSVLTISDVEKLDKWRDKIDDQLVSGETSAAYDMFNYTMKRRYERYAYALSLLDTPMTFDGDDEFVLDRSELPWPKDTAALDAIWYGRVKYDALNLKLADKTWPEIKETLGKRYNNAIKRLTQSKNEDAFQVYMNAFARQVDPHTSYLSPRNAEQFQTEMNLSLEGIGAVLQLEDDYTVIRSLVAGGPAAKSKQLAKGDKIVAVAQKDGEMVDVVGWRLDDIVELIKGPKGSEVRLQILPEAKNAKVYTVTLIRDKIRLEDRAVKSKVIDVKGEKIGVLEVPSFYVGLSEDTKKQIAELEKQDVKGIVVDLRNNGGGALTEATALTGLFIDSGPVVQVRDGYDRVRVNGDNDNLSYYNGPLTVLINRYSASASEIYAAAIQDYGRGVIIGEQSFGKGTVQQHRSLNHIYDLYDEPLGYIQYTIQKFYRINGGSTQNLGVVPDIAFPSAVDPAETGESVEDNALPWDSINPAKYNKLDDFSVLIKPLTVAHQERIAKNMEYGFIFEDIKHYQEQKDINAISLNEDARLKEQEEEQELRLSRLNQRQKAEGKKPFASLDDVPKDYEGPDPVLDEAAALTLDLVDADKE
ncbi:carboxy terminal-processing peptidase [Vibrio sp. SS-MA-C1-2]|uniref:carboxy terminal-processing peptidase n=1 Tax=Vibrio sp. SS-MA-C1-2 TaxID=2908646 RepID=UPI001F490F6D|nr:carboxy terminal-processing peptidase [Vibrio sp. SS-MA-C1-2]UJF18084.1 carboxy terminal-processing peptidase [Vibrio sp. SS-MA-C1-2]